MFDIICVTNRGITSENFLTRVDKIAMARPAGIILREKDLSEAKYEKLAENVLAVCRKYEVRCILHSFVNVAIELKCDAIHLPLLRLLEMTEAQKEKFSVIGASCHSVEDAVIAEKCGCTYITAGHIFDTDCKKGLPGRGIDFLREVCEKVEIPVYAIGGISPENVENVRAAGAAGVCVMSGAMVCEEPRGYFEAFLPREAGKRILGGQE